MRMVNKFGQMVNKLLSVDYFRKDVPSWMLDKVPNTFLNLCFKAVLRMRSETKTEINEF